MDIKRSYDTHTPTSKNLSIKDFFLVAACTLRPIYRGNGVSCVLLYSLASPILIHRHPHTYLPVSTPNTIHHSRLTVCLPDSLDLDRCLSILFWLSACE